MPGLSARAGVLTGSAAVEVGGEGEGMVLGDTVNTASRLQSIAEPGTVLVDDVTRRASRGGDRLRGRGRASGQGPRAARTRVGGTAGRRRSGGCAPDGGARGAVRRPSTRSSARSSRRATRAPPAGGRGTCRSSARQARASRAWCGSSSSTWTGSRRPATGIRAAASPTARASATGRWRRWSALAQGSKTRTIPRPSARSCGATVERFVPEERDRRLVEPRLAHLLRLEERPDADRADLFSGWRLFFERHVR